jgi:hypothetical protein
MMQDDPNQKDLEDQSQHVQYGKIQEGQRIQQSE